MLSTASKVLLVLIWLVVLVMMSACAGIPRPDADVCIVNAPGKKLKCYNMEKDFNSDGYLKAGAQPHFKPAHSIQDLNKGMFQSTDDWAKTKAYIKNLRENYEKQCKQGFTDDSPRQDQSSPLDHWPF